MKKAQNKKTKYSHLREHKNNMSDLILKRIYHLLSSGDYDIVISNRLKNEAGFIDFENDAIYLNPKIFPVEETLIHEVLHILKPDLDEQSIIEMSSLMSEKLNDNKREKIISYIKALTTKCVGFNKNQIQPTYT